MSGKFPYIPDMAYDSDFISDVLAGLKANGYNITRTSEQFGVARATVRKWRDLQRFDQAAEALGLERLDGENPPVKKGPTMGEAALMKLPDKIDRLADDLEGLALILAQDLRDEWRRRGANVSQIATALGICIDKARLLRGESTSIEEQRTHTIEIINAPRMNGAD